ncbi:conserved hypothetical protein [Streptomyces pristinaespiralis ATCC 25486]|uniref:Uncharacterized protein n=1 Tax=Streptomyces pristinaespiralis (strain ATCC 25486 / DSM 40338 / CBS 914.69 / JCM 4507 / KCC S-0507 / NBRC 13074 / NRRL 2958 / 5647) TaxID=457429 RepID=B5H6V4_STRE2|nr:conserved hypothetical protein [Streptomyces pristinaespiralis ATCC 25486]
MIVDKSLRLGAEGAHRTAPAHMDARLHPACQKRLMDSIWNKSNRSAQLSENSGPRARAHGGSDRRDAAHGPCRRRRRCSARYVTEHTLVLVRRCLTPPGSMVQAPEDGH